MRAKTNSSWQLAEKVPLTDGAIVGSSRTRWVPPCSRSTSCAHAQHRTDSAARNLPSITIACAERHANHARTYHRGILLASRRWNCARRPSRTKAAKALSEPCLRASPSANAPHQDFAPGQLNGQRPLAPSPSSMPAARDWVGGSRFDSPFAVYPQESIVCRPTLDSLAAHRQLRGHLGR
jgi:hypothetical protein